MIAGPWLPLPREPAFFVELTFIVQANGPGRAQIQDGSIIFAEIN